MSITCHLPVNVKNDKVLAFVLEIVFGEVKMRLHGATLALLSTCLNFKIQMIIQDCKQ